MFRTAISILILSIFSLFSCDDGKIYDQKETVPAEGSCLRLSAKITGIDQWPSKYSVVVAGFSENDYATISKGITGTAADGSVEVVLGGIPETVSRVEICVINRLRERIVSFYSTDFEPQRDTVVLEAGTIDAGIFNSIQAEVFDRSCTGCHGESTEAAAGLHLTAGKSYGQLVGKKADLSEEGLSLVEPGDAGNSFLMTVLREDIVRFDHTDIITSFELLDMIEDWIDNGAKE